MAEEFEDLLSLWKKDAKITGTHSNPRPLRSMVQELNKNQCFWYSIHLQIQIEENGEYIANKRGINTTFCENDVLKLKYEVFQKLLNPKCEINVFEHAWEILPLY